MILGPSQKKLALVAVTIQPWLVVGDRMVGPFETRPTDRAGAKTLIRHTITSSFSPHFRVIERNLKACMATRFSICPKLHP